MGKRIALPGVAAYVVKSAVNHDGKRYEADEPIELDTKAAQALLDNDSIDYADANAGQALQGSATALGQLVDQAQNQLMDDMHAELLQAGEAQRALTEQLQASAATIAELRQAVAAAEALKAEATRTVEVQLAEVKSLQAEREQLQQQLAAADAAKADLAEQLAAAKAAASTGTGKPKTR